VPDRRPAARPLTLAGACHRVDRADWDTIVRAIVEHTAQPIGAATMPASEQTTAAAEGAGVERWHGRPESRLEGPSGVAMACTGGTI
jgi:hypothetical protein